LVEDCFDQAETIDEATLLPRTSIRLSRNHLHNSGKICGGRMAANFLFPDEYTIMQESNSAYEILMLGMQMLLRFVNPSGAIGLAWAPIEPCETL